jgi:hypothetical protein
MHLYLELFQVWVMILHYEIVLCIQQTDVVIIISLQVNYNRILYTGIQPVC